MSEIRYKLEELQILQPHSNKDPKLREFLVIKLVIKTDKTNAASLSQLAYDHEKYIILKIFQIFQLGRVGFEPT